MYIEPVKAVVPLVVDLLQRGQHVQPPVVSGGHRRAQIVQRIEFELRVRRLGKQAFVGIYVELRRMIDGDKFEGIDVNDLL